MKIASFSANVGASLRRAAWVALVPALACVTFSGPAAAQDAAVTGLNVGHMGLDITGYHPSTRQVGTMRLIIRRRADTGAVVWNYRLSPIPADLSIKPKLLPSISITQDARL